MSRRKKWAITLSVTFAVLVVTVFILHKPILACFGSFLIVEDELDRADVIFIPLGGYPVREIAAADLYHEGYGKKILITKLKKNKILKKFTNKGIKIRTHEDNALEILSQLKVPDDKIEIIGKKAKESTYGEASGLKSYVEEHNIHTILVVTSKYHSWRARYAFSRLLGEDIRIIVRGSPYDNFDPDSWWKTRRDIKRVAAEYQKILLYLLFY